MIQSKITNKPSAVPKEFIKCKRCGNLIQKDGRVTWKEYRKRKYCSLDCASNRRKALHILKGDLPLSVYIGDNTQGGRLMARFYIGIMNAVDAGEKEYKGYAITPDMLKVAAEWLTLNLLGKPGQRREPNEKPKRSREELMASIKAIEAGACLK